jgi:hypothetical protein
MGHKASGTETLHRQWAWEIDKFGQDNRDALILFSAGNNNVSLRVKDMSFIGA